MTKPLDGIRILDFSSVLMGPVATQVLLDYGASVVKVEPFEGDVMRHSEPKRHALMGPMYLHANRGKKSIVLDLKTPEGLAIALKLGETCDIVVHNVRPEAMKRLGLAYEDFKQRNASVIYASLVGFDQRGPYASFGAVDDVIQGAAGLAGLFAAAYGTEPTYVPMVVADRIVGLTAAHALLAAIVQKMRAGQGQEIEVPMFETLAALVLGDHLGGQTFSPQAGAMGYPRLINPHRKPYRTKNGHLSVIIYTDRQWNRFVEAIADQRLDPKDQRFSTAANRAKNFHATYEILGHIFAEQTNEHWIEALRRIDIPCLPVNSLEDLLKDPQMIATGMIQRTTHPTEGEINVLRSPIRSDTMEIGSNEHAPTLGEHSQEILLGLGYSDSDIAGLVGRKVTKVAGA
jgi:crotonobetainyl-CoA:carnitine CoA-transferase CaiB-like acyl-CoA transferase